ncbi:MAG: hypothetical protein ABJG14_17700 [Sulfitobacter sp.]|uniref:hypothetical protein n=1 Tax=Alphaproteobacteria TaxID=28211 RepID=UPI0032674A6A
MPGWHPNMTAEDHERNMEDARRQWKTDARIARSMERQWRQEAERLEALCGKSK